MNQDPSTIVARYIEILEAEREKALRQGYTHEQATDRGQVVAWLDKEARQGRLRIMRSMANKGGRRISLHNVFLLEEKDGEMSSVADIGGWVSMAEIRGLNERYTSWLTGKDEIVYGYFRIKVMITDTFTDHEMFKRSDGSRIDLGFNVFAHQYLFTVDIPIEHLVDAF